VKYILEIATLLIFALVLGCDLGDPRQGKEFGISRDPSGAIIFLFKPCRSFSVDDIRLVRVEGKRFGDEDDENVLWDVQAKPPVIVTSANTLRITTDAPPQDPFTEVTALEGDFPRDTLGIIASSGEDILGRQFKVSELREGIVLDARGRSHSEEEFTHLDTCDL
jgi:hypothetical protein